MNPNHDTFDRLPDEFEGEVALAQLIQETFGPLLCDISDPSVTVEGIDIGQAVNVIRIPFYKFAVQVIHACKEVDAVEEAFSRLDSRIKLNHPKFVFRYIAGGCGTQSRSIFRVQIGIDPVLIRMQLMIGR